MRHGSLFSGIGGFDLAAQWMGWENVFHCEWNPFCKQVLKHHFPNSISYDDITKTDFTIHRGAIDILTGGFPCQPFSHAGKRKGQEDDRFLWHEMLRAIRQIQSPWVLGENVYGIVNQGGGISFEQVCVEMENEGYKVQPYILPACSIGAIHKRERVWFVAYSGSFDRFLSIQQRKQSKENIDINRTTSGRIDSNPNTGGCEERRSERLTPIEFTQDYQAASEPGIRRGDYGFSYRVDRLASLGNTIVPQVAYEIFKAIQTIDDNRNVPSVGHR